MSQPPIPFPGELYRDIGAYFNEYADRVRAAARTVDAGALAQAAALIETAIVEGKTVWACGNGGSAAIANTLQVDFYKGISTHTAIKPRVLSLNAETSTLTAVANDVGYEAVFSHQLERFGRPGDVLIIVSSSGNSPNILAAIKTAKAVGMPTIAMVGFDGGKAKIAADVALHAEGQNYGVIEDVHQGLMHTLAQFIRMKHLGSEHFGQVRF